jgi:hypothetical protein
VDPDSDPGPAIFIIDLQDADKNYLKKKVFLHITVLFEGTQHHFSKIKVKNKSKKVEIKVFLANFA